MNGPEHRDSVRRRGELDASVIIPVFQAEGVLAEQLSALTCQTFPGAWEVVIADNGSTDESVRVAKPFDRVLPSLTIVDASSLRGPSHARNIGANHARGRILLFCDADDVVSPRWIEEMVAAAPTADLIAGTGASSRTPELMIRQNAPDLAGKIPASFRFLPWNRSSNLAVNRVVFTAVGGFDESRTIGEDVEFCWRTQLKGYSFRFVETAFVAYRDRDTLPAVLRRQYIFGRAAPALYAEFTSFGAPAATWRWVARDFIRLFIASPRALSSAESLRSWLSGIAGVFGRADGLARHRLEQRTKR